MVTLSIIIPCYNCEATLGEQMNFLLEEKSGTKCEILLCDNGSTDSTKALIVEYSRKDDRVRYVDASHKKGAGAARNKGVSHAQGEFVAFLDADDRIEKGWLEAIIDGLARHGFVASRMKELSSSEGRIGKKRQESRLIFDRYANFLPSAGACGLGIRRDIHNMIGGFDENLIFCQDADYCWRVQLAGTPLVFVPNALVHVRVRESLLKCFFQYVNWGEYNVYLVKKHKEAGAGQISFKKELIRWWWLIRKPWRLLKRDGRRKFVSDLGRRVGTFNGLIKSTLSG